MRGATARTPALRGTDPGIAQHALRINRGHKADDIRKYANKRAEFWGRAKDWLKVGAIEKD